MIPKQRLRRWVFRFLDWLYTQGAVFYDLVAAGVSLGWWTDWVRSMALWPEARPNARVLELGCGPGHLLQESLEKGFWAVGVDASPNMLRLARRRLKARNLPVRLVRARAQALPFPDAFFDRVVASFPTAYIVEPETLREIARVLRPQGRVDVLMGASFPWLNRLERLLGLDAQDTMDRWEDRFRPWKALGVTYTVHMYPLPGGARGWVVSGWKTAETEREANAHFQGSKAA